MSVPAKRKPLQAVFRKQSSTTTSELSKPAMQSSPVRQSQREIRAWSTPLMCTPSCPASHATSSTSRPCVSAMRCAQLPVLRIV